MTPNSTLFKMTQGLVQHYLQGATVEQAVHAGREAGVPEFTEFA